MSTFSGYQCDKCSKEYRHVRKNGHYDYDVPPCCISFNVNIGQTYPADRSAFDSQVWCRNCVIEHGLDKWFKAPEVRRQQEEVPTTEQLLDLIIDRLGLARKTDIDP